MNAHTQRLKQKINNKNKHKLMSCIVLVNHDDGDDVAKFTDTHTHTRTRGRLIKRVNKRKIMKQFVV